jgi:hypothetical protein
VPYFEGVVVVVDVGVVVGLDDIGTKYQTKANTTMTATMIPIILLFMIPKAPL